MENKFLHIKPLELRKDKRGMGLGDLYPVILTIALVAILLAVVLFVMEQWQETTATDSGTVANEVTGWVNATPYTVADVGNCSFNTFAITGMWNYTADDGAVITSANYTADADAGTIVNLTDVNFASVNLSYTYLYGGKDCEAMESITGDFVDFIPWIGVILLIIAAAIVLGIVIRSFAGGGRGKI